MGLSSDRFAIDVDLPDVEEDDEDTLRTTVRYGAHVACSRAAGFVGERADAIAVTTAGQAANGGVALPKEEIGAVDVRICVEVGARRRRVEHQFDIVDPNGGVHSAAAGVMVGLHYGAVRFDMGFIFMIKAFAAAILGGIGSIPGAMIGGLTIGTIEVMWAAFLPSAWKDVTTFTVLILVLYLKPSGLLGEGSTEVRV